MQRDQRDQRDVILYEKMLRIESKDIFIDLRRNRKGTYLKVSERNGSGRNTVLIPSTGIAGIEACLKEILRSGLISGEQQRDNRSYAAPEQMGAGGANYSGLNQDFAQRHGFNKDVIYGSPGRSHSASVGGMVDPMHGDPMHGDPYRGGGGGMGRMGIPRGMGHGGNDTRMTLGMNPGMYPMDYAGGGASSDGSGGGTPYGGHGGHRFHSSGQTPFHNQRLHSDGYRINRPDINYFTNRADTGTSMNQYMSKSYPPAPPTDYSSLSGGATGMPMSPDHQLRNLQRGSASMYASSQEMGTERCSMSDSASTSGCPSGGPSGGPLGKYN